MACRINNRSWAEEMRATLSDADPTPLSLPAIPPPSRQGSVTLPSSLQTWRRSLQTSRMPMHARPHVELDYFFCHPDRQMMGWDISDTDHWCE